MAVYPIAWHKDCLKNAEDTLLCEEAKLARVTADVERIRASIAFTRMQIERAETEGLAGFDPEKFNKRRKV